MPCGVTTVRPVTSAPDVSVVIPTRFRPDLVLRAVHGVLAQTMPDLEVIVVVDGPDDETCRALAAIPDPRLRVLVQPAKGGAPNARNVGARAVRSRWTAMLDDDDEWLPHKLEVQLKLAHSARAATPIVASRLINRTPRAESVMPRRLPEADEPLVVWHQDEDRERISHEMPWEEQLEWLRRSRELFTPRAYAAFTMSVLSSMAAPTRSAKVFRELLHEARAHGRPGAIDYVTHLQIWAIPPHLRHVLRDKVLGRG